MSEQITLRVRPHDRVPMYGVGGRVVPIRDANREAMAGGLTEAALSAVYEMRDLDRRACDLGRYRDFVVHEDPETVHEMGEELRKQRQTVADRLAGVVVCAVDLALLCGVDLQPSLDLMPEIADGGE